MKIKRNEKIKGLEKIRNSSMDKEEAIAMQYQSMRDGISITSP